MSLVLSTNNDFSYSVNGSFSTNFCPLFVFTLACNIALINECENERIYQKIRTSNNSVFSETSAIPYNYYNKGRSLSYYQNLKSIENFRKLESNWNGNNADKIPEIVILSAFQLLNQAATVSDELRVFPTARDSIQFEYSHQGTYVEAELFANEFCLYSENEKGLEQERYFDSIDELAKEFISFYVS